MLSQQIRRQFLDYFKKNGHKVVPSAPVIPHKDPTLLFINAGMNQFKDLFLGKDVRDYSKATTSQKCVRAGGKHNDLDNVGHTSRHLTFFEMLGNFSFGDYFKEDAIRFAWEVTTEIFQLETEKIWATVYLDDEEALELWARYLPRKRIVRMGKETNYWSMGDTGPCGPCTEILYDRGEAFGPAPSPLEDEKEERYLEFWNLVFMQSNSDEKGILHPLPKPSIDTGAGLERVVNLKMGVESVFETDILRGLIAEVEKMSNIRYESSSQASAPAFHVIADHLRSLSFAIADGAYPSNMDRGYVLRKILRRAVRYGRQLQLQKPFLHTLVPKLVTFMGEDFPELATAKGRIEEIILGEEEAFLRTLQRGGNLLNQVIDHAEATPQKQISGSEAFKLKDTYGFPFEEIQLLAKDSDLTVDVETYERLEQEAKKRSRDAKKTTKQVARESLFVSFVEEKGPCTFLGYKEYTVSAAITGIVCEGNWVDKLEEGQKGMFLLNQTPFYAEMGGQIGDTGSLHNASSAFQVEDCQSPYKGVIAHIGHVRKGTISVGDTLEASIDVERRHQIANNHTATHLLHWALHQIVGSHVNQAGSVVDPHRLRFDFNHHKALTVQEIRAIEQAVNNKIRSNEAVQTYEMSYEEAQTKRDIQQFFGEKYGNVVRVVDVDFSKELCGGTHTKQLGNIGFFRIAKEMSVAAGVRRIEAVTGKEAEILSEKEGGLLLQLAEKLKTTPAKLTERLDLLVEQNQQLNQELKQRKKAGIKQLSKELIASVEQVNGTPFLAKELPLAPDEVNQLADLVIQELPSCILLFAAQAEGRAHLQIRVTEDLISQGYKAGELIKIVAPLIQGGGGGKAHAAQAGGKAPEKIPEALLALRKTLTHVK